MAVPLIRPKTLPRVSVPKLKRIIPRPTDKLAAFQLGDTVDRIAVPLIRPKALPRVSVPKLKRIIIRPTDKLAAFQLGDTGDPIAVPLEPLDTFSFRDMEGFYLR